MTEPPTWAIQIPDAPIHPRQSVKFDPLYTIEQLVEIGKQLVEQFLKEVLLAITGTFIHGLDSAAAQLRAWAEQIPAIGPLVEAITGGIGDLEALTQWFLDLIGVLGISGLGSGHPTLPAFIADIPILGPILQWIQDDLIDAVLGGSGNPLSALADVLAPLTNLLPVDSTDVITAITGTQWFQDLLAILGGPTGLGSGDPIAAITSIEQAIVDAVNAAVGQATGGLVSSIETALQQIPNLNVQGILGPADIGSALQAVIDAQVQGFALDNSLVGNSLASLQNIGNQITSFLGFNFADPGLPLGGSVAAVTQTVATNLATRSTQNPPHLSVNPSATGVFDLSAIIDWNPLPTVAITQGTYQLLGFIGCPDAAVKKSLCWLGAGAAGGAGLDWVTIRAYRMTRATGAITQIYESGNVNSGLGVSPTPVWNYLNLAEADWIHIEQGDIIAVSMQVWGSGTYYMVGRTSLTPNHPTTAYPLALGATCSIQPPVHDATGSGGYSAFTADNTFDITITIAADANCVVVATHWYGLVGQTITAAVTLDPGGANITIPGVNYYQYATNGTNYWALHYAVLISDSLPRGARTVRVHSTATGAHHLEGNAFSHKYVSALSVVGGTSGSSGTATQSPGSYQGSMVVETFATTSGSSINTMNGADQWYQSFSAGVHFSMSVADSASTLINTPVFSATIPTSAAWGGHAIVLLGDNGVAPPFVPSYGYLGLTPWFGIAGEAGATQNYPYPPQLSYWSSGGTFYYLAPVWAAYYDLIIFSDGGGGAAGSSFAGGPAGGAGGKWAGTLTRAQVVAAGGTLTVFVGGGGGGGGSSGAAGGNGEGSGVYVPGLGWNWVAGGGGGSGLAGSTYGMAGYNPGNLAYNGSTYYGGQGGQSPMANGSTPGGSGAGGNWWTGGSYAHGGHGGPGTVFIVARSS